MKVLFLCHANVGRSQVAEVFFDKLSQHNGDSAGIGVDEWIGRLNLTSKKLKDAPTHRSVEYVRDELGVDIAEKERRQLTSEMAAEADLVIVIDSKNRWPKYLDYLNDGGKVVFWDIPDPYGQDDDFAYDVFGQVKQRVKQLVEEIG